jgi:membrane protease YdiL (CAAX protease family)
MLSSASEQERRKKMNNTTSTQSNDQYSLAKILGIWAAAALPMGILGWIVAPALAAKSDPLGSGVIRVILMTVGLIWQFVLSMIVVYREEGDLRWATIRRRFWLNTPQDPKTGQPRGKLWLWLIPIIILLAAFSLAIAPVLDRLWVSALPFFAEPPGYSGGAVLESPEIQAQLVGAWWFLGLYLLMWVFNVFLGEEFLFRGVLLPKMEGVFGQWDWVANGVLFAVYHLHQPWGIPGNIVSAVFLFALPAKRFRSNWMAIIPHASEWVIVIPLLLALVLGLA